MRPSRPCSSTAPTARMRSTCAEPRSCRPPSRTSQRRALGDPAARPAVAATCPRAGPGAASRQRSSGSVVVGFGSLPDRSGAPRAARLEFIRPFEYIACRPTRNTPPDALSAASSWRGPPGAHIDRPRRRPISSLPMAPSPCDASRHLCCLGGRALEPRAVGAIYAPYRAEWNSSPIFATMPASTWATIVETSTRRSPGLARGRCPGLAAVTSISADAWRGLGSGAVRARQRAIPPHRGGHRWRNHLHPDLGAHAGRPGRMAADRRELRRLDPFRREEPAMTSSSRTLAIPRRPGNEGRAAMTRRRSTTAHGIRRGLTIAAVFAVIGCNASASPSVPVPAVTAQPASAPVALSRVASVRGHVPIRNHDACRCRPVRAAARRPSRTRPSARAFRRSSTPPSAVARRTSWQR